MNVDDPMAQPRPLAGPVSRVDDVAVSDVARSMAQLEAAKAVLDARGKEIVTRGIPLAGWWIDTPNNVLKIQVVNPNSLDAVRTDLARYIGDTPIDLEVVPGRMIQEDTFD